MYNLKEQKLFCPKLEDVAEVFQNGLAKTFSLVEVSVVTCPNLSEKPFMLASEGLCGNPSLADVGGVRYLIPLDQREKKIYDIRDIAKQINMPNALIIGAGAGPRHHVGTDCEMIANIKIGENEKNNTHVVYLEKEKGFEMIHLKDFSDFCLLGNFFVSEGKPGKVIKVVAKHRKADGNFVSAMRKALAEHYKEKPVGIGGAFVIHRGKVNVHIMPDYSVTPVKTKEDVNNALKFFIVSAPLSCLSTFVSHDPGQVSLVEHAHCFSDHGEGGHYHEDTEPEAVEYEGYFNVAETFYRIDPPPVTPEVVNIH